MSDAGKPVPEEYHELDEYADRGEAGSPTWLKGCAVPSLAFGVLIIAALIAFAVRDGDDGDCKGAAGISLEASCKAPSASSGDDESSDGSEESDGAEESEGAGEEESDDGGGNDEVQTSADLPDDGVGLPGDVFAPPAEEDLPEGAVLYTGTSGDQIGCITCDGASRFLNITKPGVVVGNEGMTSQATAWPDAGQILEFGANVSGPNKGRYGFNVFNGPTTYFNGCSMEIGSTSCLQAREGPHVEKGMPLVIIIGEGGTIVDNKPASVGDFTVDWWFVFQPD